MTSDSDPLPFIALAAPRLWMPVARSGPAQALLVGAKEYEREHTGVSLFEVSDTPCLVLLGEAGMGKSFEMGALAAALKQQARAVDLVSGNHSALRDELVALLKSDHHRAWVEPGAFWHILIDGVDEVRGGIGAAIETLTEFFDQLFASNVSIARLRVALSCRTSVWNRDLDRLIEERWPTESFRKLELAPLDPADIRQSINASGLAAARLDHITRLLVEGDPLALASRPLTLALLLEGLKAEEALPLTQADLLRLAVERILSTDTPSGNSDRDIAAARIAAATTFSDLREITTALHVAGNDMLDIFRISGATEPSTGGSVLITPTLLRECLQTRLFVQTGPDTYQWAHRQFSDYLTARYLAEHQLTTAQLESLLMMQEVGGPGGVAPQLLEVAAWTASLVPAFFDTLIERQPEVLLQSDATVTEPAHRSRVAQELLRRFESGQLVDQYDRISGLLHRLDHPGLADQLRPVIADRGLPDFARGAAIDIAAATTQLQLIPLLLETAADAASNGLTRNRAARAVARLAGPQAKPSLAKILASDLASDTEDRLRGTLLATCWPDGLTFTQLLDALTVPKQDNFIGTYQLFLFRLDPQDMSPSMAREAVAWLQKRLDLNGGDQGHLAPVMSRLFWSALAKADDVGVREDLAAFIATAESQLPWLLAKGRSRTSTLPKDASVRADLVRRVLALGGSPMRAMVTLIHHLPGLAEVEDLEAYLAVLAKEPMEATQGALAQIVVDLAGRLPIDDLDVVWETAEKVPKLKDLLSQRYTIVIDSSAAEQMRRTLASEQNDEAAEAQLGDVASTWRATVDSLLGRIETGQPGLWWQLDYHLLQTPGGDVDGTLEFDIDLRHFPGWLALDEQLRQRVVASARSYLEGAPLDDTSWLGTNTSLRSANAGVRAMHLLQAKAPDLLEALPNSVWAAWAPALIGFFANDFYAEENGQGALVIQAAHRAPGALLAAVRQIATGEKSEGLSERVLDLLDNVPELAVTALKELRASPALKGKDAPADILRFLVRRNDADAVGEVLDALSPLPAGATPSSDANHDAVVAAAVEMLVLSPELIWAKLLDLRRHNEALARTLWSRLAREVSFDRSPALDTLPEYALAQAYIDLTELLPKSRVRGRGPRVLGVPDYAEQVRSNLLSRLVAFGTNAALEQLHRIVDTLPDAPEIKWSIDEARRNVRQNMVRHEDPAEILARIGGMSSLAVPETPDLELHPHLMTAKALTEPELEVPVPETAPTGPIPEADRRVILAVATEWASAHGGISTLNRELCTALAALGHQVMCLIPDAEPTLVTEAAAAGVTLIACPSSIAIDGMSRFLLCELSELPAKPQIVLGHDHITGPAARALATRFEAQYVHVLHTIPQENEGLKSERDGRRRSVLDGEMKMRNQVSLGRSADLVVAVGPRIARFFQHEADDVERIAMMVPGLNDHLKDLSLDPDKLTVTLCYMSGRMEDAGVKGAGLACSVIKSVVTGRDWGSEGTPKLVIRGFHPDRANEEFGEIGLFDEYAHFLMARSYSTDAAELRKDYRRAAVVIMPSLSEGFGLTGLEAIAAGVPVVISAESGLAEYLRSPKLNEGLDPKLVEPCVAGVVRSPEDIEDEWVEKVGAALFDRSAAFARAAALRDALRLRLTWERAARKLSTEFLAL